MRQYLSNFGIQLSPLVEAAAKGSYLRLYILITLRNSLLALSLCLEVAKRGKNSFH
ncbi:hypothetical protein [Helicobacter sp. MIT 11-5569]|uniref:hypothetical protein n=1 Tax=Helicobacter sp. MIT 11-5569 TaxID=1548151 RepID=UPI000A42BBFB|nr:hypothetical protein [Helicobacter sp. MIT 11-5569]